MAIRLDKETRAAIRKYGPSVNRLARKRYGIGGKKLLAKLVAGESGGNADAVSSAGARGRTQFMPSSRRIAMQRYGVDPWGSADDAVHAAVLHLKGKINGSKGLEGYNPGDPNYPGYILSRDVQVPHGRSAAPPTIDSASNAGGPQYRTKTTTKTDIDGAVLDALLEGKNRHGSLFETINEKLDSGDYTSTSTSLQRIRGKKVEVAETRGGGKAEAKPTGHFSIAPTANRQGADIKPYVTDFLNGLAARAGNFEVGTGTNHSRLTVNGNVSDHWDGSAADIPAEGKRLMKLMEDALLELGVSKKKARLWAKNGGLYNITRNGVRYQIIGRTNEGGNHWNHLHVGIRPS